MTTKTDPYATKLHRRIDAFLFVFTAVVIAIVLRTSAHGGAPVSGALATAPQPFWSTLAIFTSRPDAHSVAAPVRYQFNSSNGSAANAGALAGLFSEPESSFSPVIMVEDHKPYHHVAVNFDQDQGARSVSAPSSLPMQTQISGVGSTIMGNAASPASGNAYSLTGTDTRESSSLVNSAIETTPRYAGESSNSSLVTDHSSLSSSLSSTAASSSLHAESAPTAYAFSAPISSNLFAAKSESGSFISKGISAPDGVTTNATWNGNGGSNNWNDINNWVGQNQPQGGTANSIIHFAGTNRLSPNNDYGDDSQFQQILFDSGAGAFNLTGSRIKLFNNGGTGKIENNSSSAQTVSFSGALGLGLLLESNFEFDPTQSDLIINSAILCDFNTPTINIFGNNGHVLRFNGVISQNTTGSLSINDNDTVIFAAANTYSGDTQVNAGDLRFAVGGSANSSTIRLGGTGVNSPDATLSLGVGDATSGITVGSTLNVRPSSLGTQGLRLLRNINTSGTNTYSGGIFLDADLTMRAATGGTLGISGTTDIKNHVLTIDDNSGNVNTQGTVNITGALTSSLAAGGSLVKNGANTLIIQSTGNSYTGTNAASLNANGTQIGGGTLGIYGDTSLGLAPNSAYNNIQFTGSATLQDTANNVSLNSNRNISVASGATATFDSNGNTFTIGGVINNPVGNGNIVKAGSGSVVLNGANTFSGTTTVNAGTLNAAVTNALGSTSSITVNTGGTVLLSNSGTNDRISDTAPVTFNSQGSSSVTLNTGGLSEHGVTNNTAGLGALTLQSSSIIDMGSGASILAFANSLALSGSWSGTLSIYNWSGNPLLGGGTDQLFFGNNLLGLSLTQLADFQFYSGAGTGAYTLGAIILSNGEVVPVAVPEPSTWLAAALAFGAIAWTQRKRFAFQKAELLKI